LLLLLLLLSFLLLFTCISSLLIVLAWATFGEGYLLPRPLPVPFFFSSLIALSISSLVDMDVSSSALAEVAVSRRDVSSVRPPLVSDLLCYKFVSIQQIEKAAFLTTS
jgi:hypothetical protein